MITREKKAIQGVVLKLQNQKEAYWNPECFSKVLDLKLLIIDNVHLLHEPKYLPNALRYLDWSGYPSKYFPSSFQLKVILVGYTTLFLSFIK